VNSTRVHEIEAPSAGSHPLKLILIFLTLSLVGAALVMLATNRYGAGLSPDSVNYVAAARSVAIGKGLVMYDGSPFVILAPLYPVLLGSISRVTGLDAVSSAHIVGAVLFAAIVFLTGVLLLEYVTFSPVLAVLGTAAVLAGEPMATVSVMAWTEPLFTVCVLLFLICARLYTGSASTSALAAMTLSAAVVPLVRYVGIIVVPVGVLLILSRQGTPRRTRILHLGGFLIMSTVPWGAWVARNYLLTGTLMGSRHGSTTTLLGNLYLATRTVLSWTVAGSRHGRLGLLRALSTVALVASFIVAIAVLLRRRSTASLRARAVAALRAPNVLLLFAVLYALLIVVSSTTTAFDSIGDRLLSPVYAPVIVLLFALLDRAVRLLCATPFGRYARLGLVVIVAIWLVFRFTAVGTESLRQSRKGAGGYNTVGWRESPTIDFVEHLSGNAEGTIYTNMPEAVYILARRAAELSPQKTYYRSSEVVNNIADLAGSWPERDSGLLVWFKYTVREYLFTPSELQSIADLDTLAVLQDGLVYRVSAEKRERRL
jgi:hypothetical protein